jgi:hypothetical protein
MPRGGGEAKEKAFFFEKKEAKNFHSLWLRLLRMAQPK